MGDKKTKDQAVKEADLIRKAYLLAAWAWKMKNPAAWVALGLTAVSVFATVYSFGATSILISLILLVCSAVLFFSSAYKDVPEKKAKVLKSAAYEIAEKSARSLLINLLKTSNTSKKDGKKLVEQVEKMKLSISDLPKWVSILLNRNLKKNTEKRKIGVI